MRPQRILPAARVLLVLFVMVLPAKSRAESLLFFQDATLSQDTAPPVIVMPDCRTLPGMAVISACQAIGGTLLVYSVDTGACTSYEASVLASDTTVVQTVVPMLDTGLLVHWDTLLGTALPIDLASGASCLDWSATSGGGGGSPQDNCPNDPDKTQPGICGCGTPDTDTDHDGAADCVDGCADDPDKTAPGICGCGVLDSDADADGNADCIDPDDDNDGMPDDWEEAHGLDPWFDDGNDDPDHDGLTNFEEYVLGSDPLDRNDPTPRPLTWLPVILE